MAIPKTRMKALRLTKPNSQLEEQKIEIPRVGPTDVLVRVKAAGICHSDAHYRSGFLKVSDLPVTLGHEVAGSVEEAGDDVRSFRKGDRVCLHYLVTCGQCAYCASGTEQFCIFVQMIGKHRDGGYAEFIVVPERSVFHLPAEIPFEQGAIMMCSSATSLHALKKARLRAGETVAVFGCGGLGISAIQIANALGATQVFAVDINPRKLELAARLGAIAIDATGGDPVTGIRDQTSGRGVDVALELIGLPATMRQAVQSLAVMGRSALAGLTRETFDVAPYTELINREAEIIGVSDHLANEIPVLLELARSGRLDFSHGIIRTIPMTAAAANEALDGLETFSDAVRTVMIP